VLFYCISLFLYESSCLCLSLSLFLAISLSVCLSLSLFLAINLSLYSVCPLFWVCLSVSLLICITFHSLCPFACLSLLAHTLPPLILSFFMLALFAFCLSFTLSPFLYLLLSLPVCRLYFALSLHSLCAPNSLHYVSICLFVRPSCQNATVNERKLKPFIFRSTSTTTNFEMKQLTAQNEKLRDTLVKMRDLVSILLKKNFFSSSRRIQPK
jgi:hypothetical protein